MKNEQKVTVVVPVYNIEKYINRRIDSLLNQSYKNIEILLINDGSKDNSLIIAEEKAKKDNRIKIVTQKNQGLSAARNTGIQHAKGEYICFVDGDDFVHKDYVKILLENIIENNADISVCDFSYINENDEIWNKKEKKQAIYTNIEAIKDIFVGKQETEVMAWNKLYKITLFRSNNISFPKGKLHEDNFTTYKLYYYANVISLIPDRLYYYLQRSNSIMGQKFNTKRLDALQAVEETKKFLKEKNIDLIQELDNYEIIIKFGVLNNMIRDRFCGKEREELIKQIKEKKKIYLKNKYINIIFKISIYMLIGNGNLYKNLLLFLDKLRSISKKGITNEQK